MDRLRTLDVSRSVRKRVVLVPSIPQGVHGSDSYLLCTLPSHFIIALCAVVITLTLLRPPPSPKQDGLGRAKNPVKYLQSIEQRARERQVAYETVRLLRRDVIECYRKEGVNHYENCKKPVETYARVVLKRDVGQVGPKYSDEGKNYGF
jgi:hypothetical protein